MNAAPALSHAPPRGGWILGLLWLAFLAVGAARLPAFDAGHMTRLWDVNEGLPQSSVTDIARTADGFLWVGTLHSGLARFDGLRFECHDLTTTPQLGHAGIRRLLADKPGRLWVNTYAPDLLLLEDGRFTRIMAQSPQIENLLASSRDMALFNLPENHLLRIRRGKDGVWHGEKVMNSTENPIHTWVGGADGTAWYRRQNGIIGRFENGRFVDLPSIPGFDEARASSLQADRDGRVWLTNGNRFCGWNGRMFEEASPEGAESIAGLVRIAPAGAAGVWVETAKQLRLCRDRRWIAEAKGWDPQTYGPPIGRARRIDDEGGLWIHVTNLGLVHIRADGRLSRITVADGLDSSAISCMVPDGHGGLWTGYPRGGLVNVRPRLFDTINRRDGLNDLLVSSVCEDAEGAIWIGSAGGNLSRWSDGRISTFTLPLLGNRCHTPLVAAAPDGRLWIATDGNGLWVRENQGFRNVIAPEELSGAPRALLVDRSGQVWIATFNGVFRMKGEVMETVQQIHGAGAYPGAIAEAPDGAVWIGTLGGELIRFQENGMKRIRLPGSGPRNFISALHADDDGSLWIGTQGGGLLYWHKGKFSRFTSADGLPGDRIWELLDDGLGCLWLGPGTGIARLDKAQIKNAASKGGHLTALRFGEGDGLDAASGTPELKPSCHRARDGTLWFASARGVINVDPSRVRPPGAPPATWIERVAVNGAGVDATKPLVVGPGSKSLDFTYTAPEFGHPSLIRYRHKLSGLDDGWIYAGQDRIANYRHVPPGKYEFLVSASNAAGQWAQSPARLVLRVKPHFWQTAWFRASCFLGLIAVIVGAVRYVSFRRLRARIARFEQQEALIKERARIARDIHDDVGASLTEIALLSELAQGKLDHPAQAREHIDRIFQRARALTRAVDDIVWSFNPANDSVEGLVMHIGRFAPEFLGSAGIRCRMDVPIELPQEALPSRVRHHLHLAIKEILHNIVKHSGADEVWLRVQTTGRDLTVSIEDNGCGFDPSLHAKAEADGLDHMRQRMNEVAGAFSQTSQPGAGTVTTLTVPRAKSRNSP